MLTNKRIYTINVWITGKLQGQGIFVLIDDEFTYV